MANTMTIENIKELLDRPEVAEALLEKAKPTEAVTEWLASLSLLHHIPFNNIVADARMLPKESIRLFYIDPSWINSLIDGAMSIGNPTSLEHMFSDFMSGPAKELGAQRAEFFRKCLRGLPGETSAEPVPSKPRAGLLLRSSLVTNFPALTIKGIYGEEQKEEYGPVRFEQIGTGVLLCIFPRVPNSIEIREPGQGFEFGVAGEDNAVPEVKLRGLVGENAGVDLEQSVLFTAEESFYKKAKTFKIDGKDCVIDNVLSVETISNAITQALGAELEHPLEPAEFALQMVKSPTRMIFESH
jgi:hypothetical protein